MSIIHRNGPYNLYDKNKLLPFQWAFPNDGTIRCCVSPGVEKIMVTTDDIQDLLEASPEAYAALLSLLEDLDGNSNQLTNILNRLISLEGTFNPQVNSLANLKLLTAMVDGSIIFCKGLGLYRYDSSSSATADDFFIIAPNAVPGRWILLAETAMGFSPDTGTANSFILTLPGLTAYCTGMMVWFKAVNANTGACTINANALGAKALTRPGGVALVSGDIPEGGLVCAVYDGTGFQLISLLGANLVHLTATQTLTNKTLTAPKLSSGTSINDVNGNELIKFPSAVIDAVNEVTMNNSITGTAPSTQSSGSDTNIGYDVKTKGTGLFRVFINSVVAFVVDAVASAVNYLTIKANTTGNGPQIAAAGTDTDIDVNIVPKGAGRLKENGIAVFRRGDDYRGNLLDNGDFSRWSRGTIFSSVAQNQFVADRWATYNLSGYTVEKTTNGVKCSRSTSGYLGVSQYISMNYFGGKLKGKTVTFSFDLFSMVNLSQIVVYAYDMTNSVNIISTGRSTIGRNSVTLTIPSNCEDLLIEVYSDPAANPSFEIGNTKLELNDHATPFIPKSYKEELLNCSDIVGYGPSILINGDFQIWQRGTTFTSINGIYLADRWIAYNSYDHYVQAYKSGNSIRLEGYSAVGSSNALTGVAQKVENYSYYAGKTVTLSVNLNLDTDVSAYLTIKDGINDKSSTVFTTSGVKTLTLTLSSSLTKLEVYVNFVRYSLAVGKGMNIYWAKLEVNDHDTPFISKGYGEELALCQRYYEVINNTCGIVFYADAFSGPLFKVKKRTTPTITITGTVKPGGVSVTTGAYATSIDGVQYFQYSPSGSLSIGSGVYYSIAADAEI